jgi:hypothetical protein
MGRFEVWQTFVNELVDDSRLWFLIENLTPDFQLSAVHVQTFKSLPDFYISAD